MVTPTQGYTAMNQAEITVNVDTVSQLPIEVTQVDIEGEFILLNSLTRSTGLNIRIWPYTAVFIVSERPDSYDIEFYVFFGGTTSSDYQYIAAGSYYWMDEYSSTNYPLGFNLLRGSGVSLENIGEYLYDVNDFITGVEDLNYEGLMIVLPKTIYSLILNVN